jgi:hypothetical protein
MAGNDLIWLSSIIFVLTLVGWLALDWLEDSQQWEVLEVESTENAANGLRTSEAIDIETELLFCYPLDPFAPALLWRPMPQDGWIEGQESSVEPAMVEETAGYLTPPVGLNPGHANLA